MEIPRQAKGTECLDKEAAEERHKAVPATETQPIPAANGARLRSTPMSIARMWNDLAAYHAISFSLGLRHSLPLRLFVEALAFLSPCKIVKLTWTIVVTGLVSWDTNSEVALI